MRKVLVTGGAGYIGSHTVVELAAAGYEPVIVDDLRNSEERVLDGIASIIGRRATFHRVDCNDGDAMEKVFATEGPFHGVVHFAAYKAVGESVAQPLMYYANNIGSLIVLLRLMRRHDVKRIVLSSSCTVYGQPEKLPVDESAPDRRANSPYGFTKMVCEQMLRDVAQADPTMAVVLLRYFNPIGAHPSAAIGELPLGVPNNLVPFITQTAAGLREKLTVYGDDYDTPDGSCIRDYIHVVDLAQAHVKALGWLEHRQPPTCEVFNLGTGHGSSVLEVVKTFIAETGAKLPYSVGPRREGDVAAVYADATKAHEVLGWEAKLDLRQALRDAWRWQEGLK
ncbi:MAG: UDP-glucose 4-epimerase GalE [Flavobacteriales bacterium]|nr:UDP-glucose 4-epimerase GalE [Flavobacteriales bacterium]MCB9167137.1 UDP-glucose 4-epimerase GalE [Flavobacteriales bacterium]